MRWTPALVLVVLAVMLVPNRQPLGTKQPINFSHKVMAGYSQIDCNFCHPYTSISPNAGMPSVDKCLLCHDNIPFGSGEIAKLKGYKRRNEPIPWVRVNEIPDFVRFNHECHIAAGRQCSECHGDIASMDSVGPARKFRMGFCVDCHQKNNVSRDCFICHY